MCMAAANPHHVLYVWHTPNLQAHTTLGVTALQKNKHFPRQSQRKPYNQPQLLGVPACRLQRKLQLGSVKWTKQICTQEHRNTLPLGSFTGWVILCFLQLIVLNKLSGFFFAIPQSTLWSVKYSRYVCPSFTHVFGLNTDEIIFSLFKCVENGENCS